MTADLETSTADWVVDHPETLPVFEQYGVEYTCGGKSLAYACQEQRIDPAWFLRELERTMALSRPPGPRD